MAQVLAGVARRIVPAAAHIAHRAVADAFRRAVGPIVDAAATLALDVEDQLRDDRVPEEIRADVEALALARRLRRRPAQRITPRRAHLAHVQAPPGADLPAVDRP